MTDKIVMTRGDQIATGSFARTRFSGGAGKQPRCADHPLRAPLHRLLLPCLSPADKDWEGQFPFPGKDLGLAVCLCLPDRCTGFPHLPGREYHPPCLMNNDPQIFEKQRLMGVKNGHGQVTMDEKSS